MEGRLEAQLRPIWRLVLWYVIVQVCYNDSTKRPKALSPGIAASASRRGTPRCVSGASAMLRGKELVSY